MDNYFTAFCLLTLLGVNNIWATGVLNKNRLRKWAIVRDKQPQKKEMWTLWRAHIKQKKQCNFDSGWFQRKQAPVYIVSSKFSEPKRFARR